MLYAVYAVRIVPRCFGSCNTVSVWYPNNITAEADTVSRSYLATGIVSKVAVYILNLKLQIHGKSILIGFVVMMYSLT